jgi:hypothetical protein
VGRCFDRQWKFFFSRNTCGSNNWQVFSCSASGPDGVIVGDSLYAVYMSGANGNTRVYFSASSILNTSGGFGNEITGAFPGLGVQNYPRIALMEQRSELPGSKR